MFVIASPVPGHDRRYSSRVAPVTLSTGKQASGGNPVSATPVYIFSIGTLEGKNGARRPITASSSLLILRKRSRIHSERDFPSNSAASRNACFSAAFTLI